ncbi:MAG: TonB-dependent receptor, partial [Sphingobacteriales bacterium]|nr:TonB-dependent receptor [Sphingobacteriales bacterium]
ALTRGNPSLKSATINNYDVKVEWFPSAGEIISISGFYKKMHNPIEYSRGNADPTYFTTRIPVNSGDAIVQGVEVEIRKKVDFIPFAPILNHVTVFGNGTLLKSHVVSKQINDTYFNTLDAHQLTGQPNYIVNLGLSILAIKNTAELTVSYNRTGDYINELGSSSSDRGLANGTFVPRVPHFRVKARNLVDIVITQSLLKNKCKLKFNVSNLFNERYILYQDLNNNGKFDSPVLINKNKPEANYLSGADNTVSSIRPQRTYSLSVTYTF